MNRIEKYLKNMVPNHLLLPLSEANNSLNSSAANYLMPASIRQKIGDADAHYFLLRMDRMETKLDYLIQCLEVAVEKEGDA